MAAISLAKMLNLCFRTIFLGDNWSVLNLDKDGLELDKDKTLMCFGDELTDKHETVLLELGVDYNDCVTGNSVIWHKKAHCKSQQNV